jgi:hypothetical protein
MKSGFDTTKNGGVKLKKVIALILIICFICLSCAGCATEANRVNENLTKEAEDFNIYRRVTVINCIQGDTLFEIEGLMNIKADTADNQLELIVEVSDGKYKKHFIGLSDNVTYTVEDISGAEVSKYHYEINYNPKMWLPYVIKEND